MPVARLQCVLGHRRNLRPGTAAFPRQRTAGTYPSCRRCSIAAPALGVAAGNRRWGGRLRCSAKAPAAHTHTHTHARARRQRMLLGVVKKSMTERRKEGTYNGGKRVINRGGGGRKERKQHGAAPFYSTRTGKLGWGAGSLSFPSSCSSKSLSNRDATRSTVATAS